MAKKPRNSNRNNDNNSDSDSDSDSIPAKERVNQHLVSLSAGIHGVEQFERRMVQYELFGLVSMDLVAPTPVRGAGRHICDACRSDSGRLSYPVLRRVDSIGGDAGDIYQNRKEQHPR